MKTRLAPFALALLLLPACSVWQTTHKGSGVLAEETRPVVAEFRAIEVAGHMEVDVRVGEQPGIRISTDDNLLQNVHTEIDGADLEIWMDEGRYDFGHPLKVTVTTPALERVSLAGSGKIRVQGVDSESFATSLAGSGDVVVSGRTGRLDISIAGSGDFDMVGLEARDATVEIAGSGEVVLNATDSLDVSIAGSGDVSYVGEPRVTQSVAGSGSVRARQPR